MFYVSLFCRGSHFVVSPTTESDMQLFQKDAPKTAQRSTKLFLAKLTALKSKIKGVYLEIFELSEKFQNSEACRYLVMPFEKILAQHRVPVQEYLAYKFFKPIIGMDLIREIGTNVLSAIREIIAHLDDKEAERVAQKIVDQVHSLKISYESQMRHPASDKYLRSEVKRIAAEEGIKDLRQPSRMTKKKIAELAINALKVIAGLKDEPTSSKIAADTLGTFGYIVPVLAQIDSNKPRKEKTGN